ncbi:MAG: SgcJ/EcaC family oxidoreductase [Pyrinomonadaceae bacterium]
MNDVREAITSANQNFMDAFKRGDAAGIAALYTDEATLLPPDNPMMSGREAIQSFWQGAMNMGIKEAKLETVEVEVEGNLASEVGSFALTVRPESGEGTTLTGKYVVVWKNQGGTWKLHVDIWNTNGTA